MGDSFKRKNSLGIVYLNHGKANVEDVLEVLTKMCVSIQDVYGIQQIGYSKIIVKLQDKAAELFDHLMKIYEDKVFEIEERTVNVQIVNLSVNKVVVTIKNAPFELPEYLLRDLLSQYGQVCNMRTQSFTSGNYRGIYNGIKTALMTLNRPIPSSIVLGRFVLFISYKGQPPTCLRCGYPGHFAADCTVGYWKAVNRINERDFPELRKGKETYREENTKNKNAIAKSNGVIAESNDGVNSHTCSSNNTSIPQNSNINDMDEIESSSQENRSEETQAQGIRDVDVTSPHNSAVADNEVHDLIDIDASPDGFHFGVARVDVHVNENVRMQEDTQENDTCETEDNTSSDRESENIVILQESQCGKVIDSTETEQLVEQSGKSEISKIDKTQPRHDAIVEEYVDYSAPKTVSQLEGENKVSEIQENTNEEESELVEEGNWHSVIKRKKKKKEVRKVYNMRRNAKSIIDGKRLYKKRKHAVTDMLADEHGESNKPCNKASDNLMDENVYEAE